MRALVTALVLALALPANAQQSPATCEGSWAILAELVPVGVEAEISAEGPLCVARDIRGSDGRVEVRIDRVAWEGQGLDRLAQERIPPRALSVRVDGARTIDVTGDARLDYLRRAQARTRAISGRLDMRWDQLTNRLFLDALTLDFPGENSVGLSGQAGGVDLSSMSALRTSLGSAVLATLTLDVTTQGLFERYLLEPFLALTLAPEADPAEAMPGIRDRLIAQIEALTESSFGPDARSSLVAFVGDIPAPAGDLRLVLTADPPIGWLRLAPYLLGSARDPDPLLDGLRIRFDYRPRPAGE